MFEILSTHQSQRTHLQYFLPDLQLFGQKFTVVQSVLDKFDLDTRHATCLRTEERRDILYEAEREKRCKFGFLPLICFRVHFMELA